MENSNVLKTTKCKTLAKKNLTITLSIFLYHSNSMTLETKHYNYIRNQRELIKKISVVSASYKGLTLPELTFPHIHFAAMQREEQRLYRSPPLVCNNSISLVSNVSWHRKCSLLCNRHTGTILVNSHRRYPASVSQETGKCNRN